MQELAQYTPIAEAISQLLFPYAEVVIHNLKTGRIAAIFNNLSKRAVGDESLVDEIGLSTTEKFFSSYLKTNWDGKTMKSVTAVLKNQQGKAFGLLCINLDISKWEELHHTILNFIKPAIKQPNALFENDWKEKINSYVSAYLKEHALSMATLDKKKKQHLVAALKKDGAFKTKHAASYVANVLGISRATVYKYLKEEV